MVPIQWNFCEFYLTTNTTKRLFSITKLNCWCLHVCDLGSSDGLFTRGNYFVSSYESKHWKKKLSVVKQQIIQLDNIYAISPSPHFFKERLSLKAEYDVLAFAHVEDLLLKSRSTYYEHGDKASWLLAHYLWQTVSSHQIPQIRTYSGATNNPKLINEHFRLGLYVFKWVTLQFQLALCQVKMFKNIP